MKTMFMVAIAAASVTVAAAQRQSPAPSARPLNPPPGLSDTAVAVSADGRFLTSSHAIEGRQEISVRCPDGSTYPVTVGAKLPALDHAVLQVKNQATLKNVVPLATEARLTSGQKVFATIYPVTAVAATPPRFVEGTIMSVGEPGSDERVFQVSVLIPPDGVGGAVLNEEGLVIGILVWPTIGIRGTPPLTAAPNYPHSVVKISAAAPLLSGGVTVPDSRAVADREQLATRARAATCLVFGPGGPGGVIGGVAAGSVAGSPSAPPPPPPPPAPVRVGVNSKDPRLLRKVNPVYPAAAQSAKVQGDVMISATIGSDGHVSEVRVIRSIPLLDQAALDAVRQWIYEPTIVNGKAVAVIMTVTVNFSLQ